MQSSSWPLVPSLASVRHNFTLSSSRSAGKAQLYLFLMTASHLKLKGALDPFYTGSQECLPGGPSFETSFYLAWTAIIGAVFGLLGAALFQVLLSRTWIRLAFWSTTVVSCVAAIVDIIIVKVREGGREGGREAIGRGTEAGECAHWFTYQLSRDALAAMLAPMVAF